MLRKWCELCRANQDDLANILTMEMGKPIAESKGEVGFGANFLEWFSEEAKRNYGDVSYGNIFLIPKSGPREILTFERNPICEIILTFRQFPVLPTQKK